MQWFKHDSNANTDDKLQSVLLDYGLEGYGLYWYCLEMIVNRVDKDNINFELKHDARIIARNTGCSPQKVSEMMKHFCDLGLFENNDGRITCLKIIKRLDTSMTSNKYMRELITKAKEHHDSIMTLSDNDMTKSDFIMQEEIRLDDIRTDIKPFAQKIEKVNEDFELFWINYPKKKSKGTALKAWKIKKPRIDNVLYALSWQRESMDWTKDGGKYIPYPASYLNAEGWNDEEPQNNGVPF